MRFLALPPGGRIDLRQGLETEPKKAAGCLWYTSKQLSARGGALAKAGVGIAVLKLNRFSKLINSLSKLVSLLISLTMFDY